jgi:hypothetical protein
VITNGIGYGNDFSSDVQREAHLRSDNAKTHMANANQDLSANVGKQRFITADLREKHEVGHGTDLNEDTRLVVGISGEGLGLLGWNGGVPLDESSHDASCGLDSHGQGSDVEEQEVLDLLGFVAAQDGGLDGGAVGDGLVGVDGFVQFFAVEEILDDKKTVIDKRTTGTFRVTLYNVKITITN